MNIKNHRLEGSDGHPVAFRDTPNKGGRLSGHEYLVMHFTAGSSAASSISWLCDGRAKASAHLVVARSGEVTQLVPFDRVAWHAGHSEWADRIGLNAWSIGIELDNAGSLRRQGSEWFTAWGRKIPDAEVIVARHKNGGAETGWHAYTEAQLQSALEVALALRATYPFKDVIGHDDIAPGRKTDPGPAFPMEGFRGRVMGRNEDETTQTHHATASLNIRGGPGTEHPVLPGSPLPPGTRVVVLHNQGIWQFVDVLDTVNTEMDLQGWVHGRYLVPG